MRYCLRWVLLGLVVIFVLFVLSRLPHAADMEKSQATEAQIHATKLTRDDVLGTLPPVPDQTLNDSTVAGIDANDNGIRDDVEIAIYNAHKDSARVTAAEYQYAMAVQLMLTDVYNTDTWVAAAQEVSRAKLCISETYPRNNLKQFSQIVDSRQKEVENLMLDTSLRMDAWNNAYSYITSYGDFPGEPCDIASSTLPN
jgi:hypothetical protein